MLSSCCATFGSLLMSVYAITAIADEPSVASSQDWKGSLQQTTLPDSSILNEYIADTDAVDSGEAVLRVSFVPRFGCSPLIAILVPRNPADASIAQEQLVLKVDQEVHEFPVLADAGDSFTRYSFNADSAGHQALREKFDNGISADVSWKQATAQPDSELVSTSFSLLGSRLIVETLEQQCKQHEPIPYNN